MKPEDENLKTAEIKNHKENTSFSNFCIISVPITLPCNLCLCNEKYQEQKKAEEQFLKISKAFLGQEFFLVG